MSGDGHDARRPRDLSLTVRPDWRVGPRTDAWSRLWRTIFTDICAVPVKDARDSLESNSGDA
jgi:hypothetical protein